jgi:hypothetical protein
MAPSSNVASFLGCFSAVHYNLQRFADWGDQVPVQNHSAVRSAKMSATHLKNLYTRDVTGVALSTVRLSSSTVT